MQGFLQAATDVSEDHPVVITKFIEGAEEIDVDAISNKVCVCVCVCMCVCVLLSSIMHCLSGLCILLHKQSSCPT